MLSNENQSIGYQLSSTPNELNPQLPTVMIKTYVMKISANLNGGLLRTEGAMNPIVTDFTGCLVMSDKQVFAH